ncbi:unnamed protein product [Caenorhabditis nigoni]
MLIDAHDFPAEKEAALQELTAISQGNKNLSAFGQQIRTLGNYAYDGILTDGNTLLGWNFEEDPKSSQKTFTEVQAEAEKIQRLLQTDKVAADHRRVTEQRGICTCVHSNLSEGH